jgi:aldehyde dehydrogenase (NAD+)
MGTVTLDGGASGLERGTLFIGGEWTSSASTRTLPVIDPSTQELVGSVLEPTADDMDRAVSAAREAFDRGPWPRMSPDERADMLDAMADGVTRRADKITELTVLERGVPISEAPFHAQSTATSLRDAAARIRSYPLEERRVRVDGGTTLVVREPVGVVAAICPWNAPLPTAAHKVGPALACGATVVLKPAPTTPLASYLLGDIAQEIGLPPGVLNILAADREIGAHLVANPGVDKVAFTGSTAAGKRILEICSQRVARATMELGGKSAAIVLDDIDLDRHVPGVAASGTRSTGQACWANTRVLVPESRRDEIIEAMAERYRAIAVGSAHDPDTEMGPIAFEGQLRRVQSYVQLGQSEGARLVTGGGRPDGLDRGWFIEPTLFDRATNDMRIAREEIFGPVVVVITYRSLDEAIAIANDSPFGLGGSVFSSDVERAVSVARKVRTGMIGINGMYLDQNVPFGGFKQSGIGREHADEGMSNYLETKALSLPTGVYSPSE